MKYTNPTGSGLLQGGGYRRYRPKRRPISPAAPWTKLMLSEVTEIKRQVPEYDPEVDYTPNELKLITEAILLRDPKPWNEEPIWLHMEQLLRRAKREVYTSAGTPDPSIVQGMYWRTHPDGRGVNSDEQRSANGASFYKDGKGINFSSKSAL